MAKQPLSIARNTLYNTLGSCFYLACQWLMTVAVSRLGGVESGGVLTLAMSVTNMFYTLSVFGVRTFQVSDFQRKYSPGQYVTARLVTCGAAFLLCAAYSLLNPAHTGYEAACVIVYMIFRTGEALSDENQALQQVEGRMDTVCWSFFVRGILLIGTFCGVLAWTGSLLWTFGAISVTTGLVVFCYEFPMSRRMTEIRVGLRDFGWISLLRENVPLMLNTLMMTVCVSIPRTALQAIWGNWWMGIYGFIASPAAIVQSAALWLFMPSLTAFGQYYAENRRADFYRLHRRILGLLLGVTAAVLLFALLCGKWALGLLYGAEVAEQSGLLIPTLATTMLIAGEYYLSALLTVARNMKAIFWSNAIGTALAVALSWPLIRPLGAAGVNLVVGIGMGTMVVIQGMALRTCLRRHFAEA